MNATVTNVYDAMGRLQFVVNALSENARQYGYDLAGRMVTCLEDGSFPHNGDNLKRIEEVDGDVTTIVWDGADYLGDVI